MVGTTPDAAHPTALPTLRTRFFVTAMRRFYRIDTFYRSNGTEILAYSRVRIRVNVHVQHHSHRTAHGFTSCKDHPAGLGADPALDQRGGDDPDDHVGLADLQCLAAVRFPLLERDHDRRLARRRDVVAFCGAEVVDGTHLCIG